MNVLITGGYSFISRLTAKRFYKEGYQVTLIGNEDVKAPKDFKEKCKFYHMDGTLEHYDWLFKSGQFNMVIHIEDKLEADSQKRFNEFATLVNLGTKYKIDQFIFTPQYKNNKKDLYTQLNEVLMYSGVDQGLNLAAIVFGEVYGPGARKEELDTHLWEYMQRNTGKGAFKPNTDYYYIDDLVDAIYKIATKKCIGVFELSVQDAIQGWEPKYSLEAGIEKMTAWYEKNRDFRKIDKQVEKQSLLKRLKVLLPYGENILFFLITFLIAFQTKDSMLRYNIFPLDFNLIYIFLISSAYGMCQGVIAIFLACFSYIMIYLSISPELASIVYNQGHIIQLLIYIIVGIVTVYVVDNKRREIDNLKDQLEVAAEKQKSIEEVCNQTIVVKNELQNQILNTDNSLGKIYTLSQELNSLLVEDVYYGAVHTLEKLLKTNSIFIYKCNKEQEFLRLVTRSKEAKNTLSGSIRVDEFKELRELMQTKEVFINYELNPQMPMMMAPILYGDQVIAVVFINEIPFESLTLYYENFFRVAIGLIQNAIGQALAYEAAIENKKYIGESQVIRINYFKELIQNKQKAKSKFNIPYTILKVEQNQMPVMQVAEEVKGCIRDTDYMGSTEKDELYIMLSNSDVQNSELIVKRLNMRGIEVTPYHEVRQ